MKHNVISTALLAARAEVRRCEALWPEAYLEHGHEINELCERMDTLRRALTGTDGHGEHAISPVQYRASLRPRKPRGGPQGAM